MNWPLFIRSFLEDALWQGLCREILLVAELALLAAMLAGIVGKDNGVRLLFWHEDPRKQLWAGLATALFTSTVLLVGFLLHAQDAATWARHLPADIRDKPTWQSAWFVFGAWTVILLAALLRWAFKVVRRLVASAAVDRARARGYWPFVAGCGVGIVLATPLIGIALFWLAAALHLADYVTSPELPPGERQMHGLAAALTLLMTAAYLITALQKWSWLSTPATGFCLLLSLLAAIYGFCKFQAGHPAPFIPSWLAHPLVVIAVIAALVVLGGLPRYKFRFQDLNDYYRGLRGSSLPDATRQRTVVTTAQRIIGARRTDGDPGKKRPMVLVCASGGGLRAAVWTAAVLCKLEEMLPGFTSRVALICGASGGMVGAGYYVASLAEPDGSGKVRHSSLLDMEARRAAGFGPSPIDVATSNDAAGDAKRLLYTLADDMLSSVFKGMLFRDLLRDFLPFIVRRDRGEILEKTWWLNMGSAWQKTFADLAPGEQAGWRPSLVFSPMLVEDGRRLLVSNLDLEKLTTSDGNYVTADRFYSQSSFEFFKLFPASWPKLRVSAPARMSASFPYFSPAAVLPEKHRRRVVDAGYYDNYGVTIAANWLEEILNSPSDRALFKEHVSGVAVVEIRDGLTDRGVRPDGIGKEQPNSALSRGAEELSSPVEGLLSARDSVSLYRNDEKLDWLSTRFNNSAFGSEFFTNVLFQFSGRVPLSWYLTSQERDELIGATENFGNVAAAAAKVGNAPDAAAFQQWWAAKSK
jgi:hypothetical protein